MRKPLFTLVLSSTALALGASACGFDPGNDYAVTVTWFLNGAAPDATRCAEQGISEFRLTMDGPGRAVEARADCDEVLSINDTTYGGFETTRAFDFGERYDYTIDALDSKAEPLFTYQAYVTAYSDAGDFVDLPTVDVFQPSGETASFSASWLFSSGDLATDCAANRVEDVQIWVASATDEGFEDAIVLATAKCADGGVASKGDVLALGSYLFKYVAVDARGAIAEAGDSIPATVDEAGDLALPRQQFKGL